MKVHSVYSTETHEESLREADKFKRKTYIEGVLLLYESDRRAEGKGILYRLLCTI
jgi:hypothetical protein